MPLRLSTFGLLVAVGGCCLESASEASTGSTGGAPQTCEDIVCQPPGVCVGGDCGPHCGCMSDANCPAGQGCDSTVDCGGACYPKCPSGFRGFDGMCCVSQCMSVPGELCAQPNGCDDAGLCRYPAKGTVCGTTCMDSMLTEKLCDGAGGCGYLSVTKTCPDNLGCADDGACYTSCVPDGGCAIGYSCQDGGCTATSG